MNKVQSEPPSGTSFQFTNILRQSKIKEYQNENSSGQIRNEIKSKQSDQYNYNQN
jgi:hypothetical protein